MTRREANVTPPSEAIVTRSGRASSFPLLLGDGVRLFEDVGQTRVDLNRARTIEILSETHLRFDGAEAAEP